MSSNGIAAGRALVDAAREYAELVEQDSGYHPEYRRGVVASDAVQLAALAAAGLALREAMTPTMGDCPCGSCNATRAYDAALAATVTGISEHGAGQSC